MNQRLIKARKDKGLTQEQLASLVGIDRSTLAHYEKGRKPYLDTAIVISQVLELPVEYLFSPQDVLFLRKGELTGTES